MKPEERLPIGVCIPRWRNHQASAIQALARGEADPKQQKDALSFIINDICLTYDMPYRSDSQRDTDFLLGRIFVGQQIVKLIKVNLMKVKEK
jgi:hypothetical protein